MNQICPTNLNFIQSTVEYRYCPLLLVLFFSLFVEYGYQSLASLACWYLEMMFRLSFHFELQIS
uniref:Uncharacterized protein n=1 Tax=Solanum tuberosum TaxID=4113 RepID=M1ALT2_SOLTU